jgi:hypothetical protein
MPKTDVLILVEDPGAANFVGPLHRALAGRGWQSTLMTLGTATDFLGQHGITSIKVEASETAAQLLARFQPRLVLVGTCENLDSIGLELLFAARRSGIVTVGAVDSATNADFGFRGRTCTPLAYAPDWLLLPDQFTRDKFVALGYPPHRIFTCGHPHYDRVRAVGEQLARRGRADLRRGLFPSARDNQPVVVFLTEISSGCDPAQFRRSPDYSLTGRGGSVDRTAIVLEEFLDAARVLEPPPHLVLRLHPKEKPHDYQAYSGEFHQFSNKESGLEVVYAADLVVGMSSMLIMEAALLGRPTLAILPRLREKEWLPSIRMGITPCVTTRDELRRTLKQFTQDSQSRAQIDQDGLVLFGALERALAAIEELIGEHQGHAQVSPP